MPPDPLATLPPGWAVERDVALSSLSEHPENPRRGDVAKIEESIAAHGFVDALVVQTSTRRILSGNHRARVARKLGHVHAPVVIWADVDDTTAKRLLLAYNRAGDDSGYDRAALLTILRDLDATTEGVMGTLYTMDDVATLARLTGELGNDASAFLADLMPELAAQANDVDVMGGTSVAHAFHVTFPFTSAQRDHALTILNAAKLHYQEQNSADVLLAVLDEWADAHDLVPVRTDDTGD